MLGVLWIILKTILILLAVLLGLILIALFLPVSAYLSYEKNVFSASVRAFGLKYQLVPAKDDEKKKKKPKKAQKKKAQQKTETKPAEKPKEKKKRLQLSISSICTMVSTAGTLLRRILGGLKIRKVRIRLAVQGADAADTAVQYGKTNAWLHSALAVLRNYLDIRFEELAVLPDFNAEKQGTELFSCKITGRLIIIVIAGIRALWQLWKAEII